MIESTEVRLHLCSVELPAGFFEKRTHAPGDLRALRRERLALLFDRGEPRGKRFDQLCGFRLLLSSAIARDDAPIARKLLATLRRFAGLCFPFFGEFYGATFRCRGLLNDGPQALVYGLGGIYSVSGYPSALIRSHSVAWSNAEARVQLWDYSAWRVPIHSLVIPAADGFLYADTGVARGTSPLFSAGLGLRLRLGFLAFEWRRPFRTGQESQRGLALLW